MSGVDIGIGTSQVECGSIVTNKNMIGALNKHTSTTTTLPNIQPSPVLILLFLLNPLDFTRIVPPFFLIFYFQKEDEEGTPAGRAICKKGHLAWRCLSQHTTDNY